MIPKDIRFHTETPSLDKLMAEKFKSSTDGILTPSQISRVVESVLIRLPLPALYWDHYSEEIFGNGYLVSAVRDFIHQGSKILNVTKCVEEMEGKTFQDLDRHLQRRILETHLTMYVLAEPRKDIAQEVLHQRQK